MTIEDDACYGRFSSWYGNVFKPEAIPIATRKERSK